MPDVPAELLHAEIEASTGAIAALVDSADETLPIPTCPQWTLRQLATHVGRAHRWAAEIVGTRSPVMIEFRAVPGGKLPEDPAERAPWLISGAALLVRNLRDAGDDLVWTFTGLAPAGFWARRMAHETVVHRADAQCAAGQEFTVPAMLAADAIEEWLTLLMLPELGGQDKRDSALPQGRSLHIHATDGGLDGTGEWLVTNGPAGFAVTAGHGKADAALSGPAADLLLVLMRRKPASDETVRVFGDRAVVDTWLAHSSF
jgi:uncharacterized protein (TIGR03083 family)